jgi:hypothetical protein
MRNIDPGSLQFEAFSGHFFSIHETMDEQDLLSYKPKKDDIHCYDLELGSEFAVRNHSNDPTADARSQMGSDLWQLTKHSTQTAGLVLGWLIQAGAAPDTPSKYWSIGTKARFAALTGGTVVKGGAAVKDALALGWHGMEGMAALLGKVIKCEESSQKFRTNSVSPESPYRFATTDKPANKQACDEVNIEVKQIGLLKPSDDVKEGDQVTWNFKQPILAAGLPGCPQNYTLLLPDERFWLPQDFASFKGLFQ